MPNLNIKSKNASKSKYAFGPSEFALLLPEIEEFLSAKDFAAIKNLLKSIHSIDIAEGWHFLDEQEKIILFKLLSLKRAVEVFEDLRFQDQKFLLDNLDNADLVPLLNEMSPDERVEMFNDLPEKVKKKLFSVMKKEEAEDTRLLLNFKENTAGGIMTTDFVTIKKDMTCRKAIIHLQEAQTSGQAKEVHSVFVTDDERHLIGGLSLQRLITSPPDILVKDVMSDVSIISLSYALPKEDVAIYFSRYDLLDAPVVDEENRLLGIITIDDVVDIIESGASKDIYEIGKMIPSEGEEIHYERATVWELVKRRAPWLFVLILFHIITGAVLKNFQYALGTVVALAFFIPMLLDTGGNAGSQTAITIIRGMAIGDVTFKNIWKVAKLEVFASLIMGFFVGTFAFIRALSLEHDLHLAAVVGITMYILVLLAICTGLVLPVISKRIGWDPAVLAGPITTSVVDVAGLVLYFKIAQAFIPILR